MEWISVKDRLPEGECQCIIYDGFDVGIALFDFYRSKSFMSFDDNGYKFYISHITHWMPLPEPPKEE